MKTLDLEKIDKNIEIYKYMLYSNTRLDSEDLELNINKHINEKKDDFFDYILSFNLNTWCDPNLEDVTLKLNDIRIKIENFLSQYQLDNKGKIIKSNSKTFIFMGPMLSNLNFSFDQERLTAFFEYEVETLQTK